MGNLAFDVPRGGGDVYLTEWARGPAPSALISTLAPGAYAVAGEMGIMLGPWHVDT